MKGIGNLNQISASTEEKTFQVKLGEWRADLKRSMGRNVPAVLRALAKLMFPLKLENPSMRSKAGAVLPCTLWNAQP